VIEDFRCKNKTIGGGANIDLVTWIILHHLHLNVVTIIGMIEIAIRNPLPR